MAGTNVFTTFNIAETNVFTTYNIKRINVFTAFNITEINVFSTCNILQSKLQCKLDSFFVTYSLKINPVTT